MTAASDAYAMPVTVATYSAISNLKGREALIVVVEDGLEPHHKRLVSESVADKDVRLRWVRPPRSLRGSLGAYFKLPLSSAFRLLLPEIVPGIKKVVYIDADTVVLHDLGELWSHDMGPHACLAVQEPDGPHVIECFERCNYGLGVDFAARGVFPEHKYFNAGVMLIDLEVWRRDHVMQKALAFLEDFSPKYGDQDALNVVLAGRWGELDPRWNQTSAFYFEQWNNPFPPPVIEQVINAPFIVHYTGPFAKPWKIGGTNPRHPKADLYFKYLSETAWQTQRPTSNR